MTQLPRIQFRLSKMNDEDLIRLFEGVENTTDIAKKYIRLGMAYDNMKKGKIILRVHNKDSITVHPNSKDSIEVLELQKEHA